MQDFKSRPSIKQQLLVEKCYRLQTMGGTVNRTILLPTSLNSLHYAKQNMDTRYRHFANRKWWRSLWFKILPCQVWHTLNNGLQLKHTYPSPNWMSKPQKPKTKTTKSVTNVLAPKFKYDKFHSDPCTLYTDFKCNFLVFTFTYNWPLPLLTTQLKILFACTFQLEFYPEWKPYSTYLQNYTQPCRPDIRCALTEV